MESLLSAGTVLGPGDTAGNPNKMLAWEVGKGAITKQMSVVPGGTKCHEGK